MSDQDGNPEDRFSRVEAHLLVEQCALMNMIFENDQGVRLFEHVH